MRTYVIESQEPFTVDGKKYSGVTCHFRKLIHPRSETPKTYKRVSGFLAKYHGTYESGYVRVYKTRTGHAMSVYKDGCFWPYYCKCTLNE